LVDCVSAGHPTFLTKEDIDGAVGCGVLVQVLAPEIDAVFTKELKRYCFEKMSEAKGAFEYRHFPGVVHACFTRGNEKKEGERDAMVRGKGAFVAWAREWLKVEE
jgi:hypothetical protein